MVAPDVHELRAYNHLARLACGEYLLLLQGDYCLLREPFRPLHDARTLMEAPLRPRLALLGGNMGCTSAPRGVDQRHVRGGGEYGMSTA